MLVRAPGGRRDADPQGRRGREPAARPRPGQAARRRRDDRLGAHARRRSARPSSTPQVAADTLGAVLKERDDLELVRDQPRRDHLRCLSSRRLISTAGRVRARAAGRRLAGRVRRRPDLLRRDGAARPDRPGRSVLGRPHARWSPGATASRSTTGCSGVLPRRRAATSPEPLKLSAARRAADAGRRCRCPSDRDRRDGRDEEEARLGLVGLGRCRCCKAQVVRRLHAGGARRAAPDHDQDQAAPPPRRRTRRTARASVGSHAGSAAYRPRDRCACTASRRSCTGAAGKARLRPLILILDVSGSMADYSRNLLQFAYSAKRASPAGSRCSASGPG